MHGNDEPSTQSSSSSFLLKFVLPAAGFWGMLFALGFPPATFDDLFFIGAPVSLAAGGPYQNPWLNITAPFSGHGFFLHPPFYSYVLAGWLKVFGVRTGSFLSFQCLCGLVASLNVASLFRRWRLPVFTSHAVMLALAGLAATQGLRQDLLGIVFLSGGLAILARDGPLRWLAGLACLGAAALTMPVSLAYSSAGGLGLLVVHHYAARAEGRAGRAWWARRIGALLISVSVITFFFLLCVNFNWRDFLHDFTTTAGMRRIPAGQAVPFYAAMVLKPWRNFTDLPVLLLFFAGVFLWLRQWSARSFAARAGGLVFLAGFFLHVLLYSSTFSHITFFCWVAIAAWLGALRPGKLRLPVLAVAALIFLMNHSLLLLRLAFQERPAPAACAAIRQFVAANPDVHYGIDASAARYVFDYHLPPHTRAWEFFQPLPLSAPSSVAQRPDGWVWIVSTYNLGLNVPDSGVSFARIRFLGREFQSLPEKPSELVMLK